MKNYFIAFVVVLIIGVIFFEVFLPISSEDGEPVLFSVERGQGSRDISLNLEKEGLIKWASLFRLYVLTVGVSDSLQAGDYLLSPSMNIPEIADFLSQGNIAKEKITIVEGWDAEDIASYLENKGMFQSEEVFGEMDELQGYLFPDTYWLRRGTSLAEIIEKMRDNFEEKTEGLAVTPQVIIMASILEREVKTKEEKELAADVLWKRLGIGMALQVDAAPETYERPGLPEKPLCNPGLESIKAALFPKESSYWYYLSTPEGETIFSNTLEEHNVAKAKHLH